MGSHLGATVEVRVLKCHRLSFVEAGVSQFMDSFNQLADKKGLLATKELGTLLRSVGENPTIEELQDMINDLDKDATGVVRFPDFLLLMANKVDQELVPIDIQEAFTVFDNDGNGHITRSE